MRPGSISKGCGPKWSSRTGLDRRPSSTRPRPRATPTSPAPHRWSQGSPARPPPTRTDPSRPRPTKTPTQPSNPRMSPPDPQRRPTGLRPHPPPEASRSTCRSTAPQVPVTAGARPGWPPIGNGAPAPPPPSQRSAPPSSAPGAVWSAWSASVRNTPTQRTSLPPTETPPNAPAAPASASTTKTTTADAEGHPGEVSDRTPGTRRGPPQLLPTDLEVLPGPELEDRRQDALRHRGDGVVIGQHGVVVVLARIGRPVLGGRQLPLQLDEALAGPQLRIRLDHREQALQRPGERTLRRTLFHRPMG